MDIFPKEIINETSEKHFFRFSRQSGIIYLTFIVLLILVFATLPLVEIDISVQSRGIIRSKDEANKLFSPITGQIERIAISENQQVRKGDTLIWFRKNKLTETISFLERKTNELQNFIDDIENILDFRYQKLTSPKYISDHARYRQKLREFDLQIDQLRRDFERTKSLYEKAVIPRAEYEQKEFDFQQKKEEKGLFVAQNRSEWNTALTQFKTEKISVDAEKKQRQMEEEFYSIVAGIDGYISGFSGITAGDFVLANQQIANIAPTENLIVESYVPTGDIGYLHSGTKARFQVDAYNYNEWGLATGEVIDISNQPIQTNGSYVFKVKCCLDQNFLMLKSGCRGQLKNGLTLTSRFKVARRSLFQLLYDKADNWMNPKMLANKTDGQ
ncbi:MAG: HlyD family efflux transporter periplasmic adaptor subunit [Prolixibacteraceae bacterium]|jgi:HlyD family secretion protein|nr:HlyD family efflux transporter periplasmic adaptor subunit [Prolixibacteraceae bacterium]